MNDKSVNLSSGAIAFGSAFLMSLFLIFDMTTPLGAAAGVPYIAMILVSLWSSSSRLPLYLALAGSVLIIHGYFHSPDGGTTWKVIANLGLALFAIWVTALLIMRWKIIEQANATYRTQVENEKLQSTVRLKQAEEEAQQNRERLAHVDRVSAMGEMAAGIAHEINQPLTAIATYTEACQRMLKNGTLDEKDLSSVLGKIGSQAHRAGEIIRHLRSFVKKRDSHRDTTDCNELVREVVSLVRPEAKLHNIAVVLNLAPKLPAVNVDAIQIQQVILNLVNNGIDSMVEASLANPEIKANEILIKTRLLNNDAVEIGIRDQGIGMSDYVAQHIFDPFFTTKAKGMGMGLSISRSILKSHGGSIQVRPVAPRGSLFYVSLPTVVEKRVLQESVDEL